MTKKIKDTPHYLQKAEFMKKNISRSTKSGVVILHVLMTILICILFIGKKKVSDVGSALMYATTWVIVLHLWLGAYYIVRYLKEKEDYQKLSVADRQQARQNKQNLVSQPVQDNRFLSILTNFTQDRGIPAFGHHFQNSRKSLTFLNLSIDIIVIGLIFFVVLRFNELVIWASIFAAIFSLAILKYRIIYVHAKTERVRAYSMKKISNEIIAVPLLLLLALAAFLFQNHAFIILVLQILCLLICISFFIWLAYIKKVYSLFKD